MHKESVTQQATLAIKVFLDNAISPRQASNHKEPFCILLIEPMQRAGDQWQAKINVCVMPVDKSILWEHLEKARDDVVNGEKRIARQRELIAELERDGHYSVVREAHKLLHKLEDVQQSYVQVLIVLQRKFARFLN